MIDSLLNNSSTAFVVADSSSAFRKSLPFTLDGKSVGLIICASLVGFSRLRMFRLGADHRVRSSHCARASCASATANRPGERQGRLHAFVPSLQSSPCQTWP